LVLPGAVGVVQVIADQPHPGPPLRGEGEGGDQWMAIYPGRPARFGWPPVAA